MAGKSIVVLTFVVALVAQGSAQDAKAVIASVSKAMGVETLKTIQYSATGFDFALGQAPNAASPWPKFINKSYTRAIDFEAPASRVARVRVQGENPPRGGGQQPIVGEHHRINAHRHRDEAVGHAGDGSCRKVFCARSLAQCAVAAQTVGGRIHVSASSRRNKASPTEISRQNMVERIET